MLGFSLCFDGLTDGFYLPFNHARSNLTDIQRAKIFRVLSTREALVFHNAVYDLRVLARNGFDYRGKFYDTMLMAHWIDEEQVSYKLEDVSPRYGGKPKAMPDVMSAIIDSDGWDAVPLQMMIQYSGNDAFIEHELFRKLLPMFQEQNFDGELWDWEQRFIRDVMGPMIDLGIKIDTDFCMKEYMKGSAIMTEALKELGYSNMGPKAMTDLFIDKLKLGVVKDTPTGRPCFDKDAMAIYEAKLEKLDNPTAQTVLKYRGWQKTISANYKSYLDNMDTSHILHPGYKLHGTRTGRLSCEKPALQQIPKSSDKEWNGNSKSAFVAREGYELWTIDYSQLQFRMAVSVANEEELVNIFNTDRDIFTEMATQMGWLRADVKTLVYLILFGGGAQRAMDAFGLKTKEEGRQLVDEFHSMYPGIKRIARKCQNAAQAQGYVTYWTGRRRHFKKSFRNPKPAYYRAFNAWIQGGEAEIMKRAMITLQEEVCDEHCRMVLQIHDEIAFEITSGMETKYLPRLQEVMERVPKAFCEFTGVSVAFPTSAGKWGEK